MPARACWPYSTSPPARAACMNSEATSSSAPSDGPLVDCRRAEAGGARGDGALHILRHTFCSHLAKRGVLLLSIKELAGHRSLRTTMRYMYLGKGEKHRAIQMLEEGGVRISGVETFWRRAGA